MGSQFAVSTALSGADFATFPDYRADAAQRFEDAFYAHHPSRMERTKSVTDFIKGPNPWVVS